MASFTFQSVGTNSVNIRVYPSPGYAYYRVFVRPTSATDGVYDQWFSGITSSFDAFVSGLSPATSYTVNVAYSIDGIAATSTWIGAQTFVTGGGGTTTYYAQVDFNANGGTGAPSSVSGSTSNTDQYVVLSIPYGQPTRSGYTFLGWSLSATASTPSYFPGGTITVYGTTATSYYTLYAVWSQTGGGVRIGNGYNFDTATAYIWNGAWQRYTPYVWNNGWKKAN